LTGGNPTHALQTENIGGFFGEPQMTEMHRIEACSPD
jgi:hypothetical protein